MLRLNLSSLINRPLRLIGWVIAATLIGGCASPVRHQVMVFHDWPANMTERTFRFAQNEEEGDDLKRKTWQNIIRQELVANGFTPSENPGLEIGFDFQTRERKIQHRHHYPYFTPYFSFGRSFRWGGLSIAGPLWGWGYSHPVVSTVFEHELNITMKQLRANESEKVFEGSSVTRRNGTSPVHALPYLTRAILKDFPGESGVVKTVDFEPAPR
jgi:hypothetical protein